MLSSDVRTSATASPAASSVTTAPISGEISQPTGGEGGGPAAAAAGTPTGTPTKNFSPKCREMDLAPQLGLARPALADLRKTKLRQGLHWEKLGRPAVVWYSEAGNARVLELLGVKTEAKVEVAPAPAGHRIANEQIPRGPQNGLILKHGRPGWWTADEALVVSNGFANRKAILVEFAGRQLICRVKDARNFVPRMLIPVRRYGEVVLAARQPRFPGKW